MKNHFLIRTLLFVCGVCINSFGIAFITKAALGTSPISSVPYVISLKYNALSFGTVSFIMNMVFIVIQVILLRRNFHPIQLFQIAVNIIFSFCIDISMNLLSFLQPQNIVLRLLSLLAGCLILAFGICIEVAPDILMVPGEGIVKAIAVTTKIKFGMIKILFDCTLMAIALILSLLFFHRLNGIGIGTVISAVLVGLFVSLFHKTLPFIKTIESWKQNEAV